VSLKEGDSPSRRGDNSKRVKYTENFQRTSRPKLIKRGTNYPLVKRIQICSNKGPARPSSKGDNHRNVRKGWGHLKVLFLRAMKPEKLNFT
jgi:hypothetical protein